MPTERRLRKFVRQWRKRYPYPVPWVDERANKECRRSENQWLAQFDGVPVLKRRDVLSLVLWRYGGDAELLEKAAQGLESPAAWGHARRCIKKALATDNPALAMNLLLGDEGGITGWGPELASLLLGACRPGLFVAGDQRRLRSLAALGLHEHAPGADGAFTRADWWSYLRACRRLSELAGVPLRDVGRALWAGADDAPDLPA
jgi:hypothetical protein